MKRRYPDGPKFNLAMVAIAQMFPKRFPFDALAFALDLAQQYGDIAYYSFGPLQVYYLNHPDLVRQVAVEQADRFYKPRLIKYAFRPFAGQGLLTNDGDSWKQQRKLMQPAFHARTLTRYGDSMVEHTQRMLHSFADGEVRDMGAEITQLTLGIVVKTLFGSELPRPAAEIGRCMLALIDAANQRVNSLLRLPSWIPTGRNRRERRAIAELDAVLLDLIRERRASREAHDDLLSVLLAAVDEESGARMTDRQLRDEMMTLFLAGHETTANALTWALYVLARHPDVEARVAEEVDRVLAGRSPTVTDLADLPYGEMVIRETIRLYPPAPGFGREPVEEVNIGGYDVAKGSLVFANTYAMQRDERFFPDAGHFDPERFAAGWEERIPRYAYLPFGSGPRVCIGNGFAMMETRLILAAMVQRYRFKLEGEAEIRPVQIVTLRPARPVRMRLERRWIARVTSSA